jgi:hypothetical protein
MVYKRKRDPNDALLHGVLLGALHYVINCVIMLYLQVSPILCFLLVIIKDSFQALLVLTH